MDGSFLRGKTALVTGSSRGVGKIIAERLGKQGARIVVHGKHHDGVSRTVEEFLAEGIAAVGVAADFKEFGAITTFVAAVHKEVGAMDFLIHNAGQAHATPLENITAEEYDTLFAVNVQAPFFLTQAFVPAMIQRRSGRIIFMSSISGIRGRIRGAAYAASKSAVIGFTHSLARELGPHGITVNAIAPGAVQSDSARRLFTPDELDGIARRTPLGRLGTPEDIAEAVQFLLSERASFITGTVLVVDGGYLVS